MTFLDPQRCREVIFSTLRDLQVAEASATRVAEALVTTSLRGVDTHGINIFPNYVRAVRAGRINGQPHLSVSQTGPSALRLNADHAFGHYAGSVAMDKAIEMASATGSGAVSVSHSTHFGAAAFFALQAPPRDCLGFVCTNADALVKAHGAREAFFGTNPICWAAPLAREDPLCLDMATSQISWNKIRNIRKRGEKIPANLAFDREGNFVDDPNLAVSLSPAGSYKGFGLGLIVDVLCALLAEGPISKDILPMYDSPIEARREISHFFLALSIGHFTSPARFRAALQSLVDRVRSLEPMDPDTPVMVAGDPEKQIQARRSNTGIPIEAPEFDQLLQINRAFARAEKR